MRRTCERGRAAHDRADDRLGVAHQLLAILASEDRTEGLRFAGAPRPRIPWAT